MRALVIVAVGCGSASPPPAEPPPAPVETVAVDAPAPDVGPSAELAGAPAWVFRYNAPGRVETWTLQHHGETAMIVVEREREYAVTYLGTATRDGAVLKIAVAAGVFRLSFLCKQSGRVFRLTCDDEPVKPIDVLDCLAHGKATPMAFGLAPGVEYADRETCSGYRLLP